MNSDHTTKQMIKTVWTWHKDINVNQWNKVESPKIKPHTNGYLIFDKGGYVCVYIHTHTHTHTHNGEKTISLTSGAG